MKIKIVSIIVSICVLSGLLLGLMTIPAQAAATFSPTGSMTTARVSHRSATLSDGRVLIVDGRSAPSGDANGLASAEIYDPATGTFFATGGMSTARLNSVVSGVTVGSGNMSSTKILVAGGVNTTSVVLGSAELYDPATGTFTPTGSMSTARQSAGSTMLADGRVLITGGNNGAATLASAEIYDPATGTFSPTGTMTVARQQHGSTRLSDGRVLIVGGTSTIGGNSVASAEIYDPATGTFTATGSMGTARQGYGGIWSVSTGKYLIAGGESVVSGVSTTLASAEIYDPVAGTFSITGNMGTARRSHGITNLPDGQILVTGGRGTTGTALASAEVYDPLAGAFSSAGSMTTPRTGHRVQRLSNGNVLIAGGQDANNAVLATAELYIPAQVVTPAQIEQSIQKGITWLVGQQQANGCWSPDYEPVAHTAFAVVKLEDRAFELGYTSPFDAAYPYRLNVIKGLDYVFNNAAVQAAATFSPTGNMTTPRVSHRSASLPDGRVLVVDGRSTPSGNATGLASAELYDPATGTFTPTGGMSTARLNSVVTGVLSNSKVLVAGGVNTTSVVLASAELYDPAIGTFTPTGTMVTARQSAGSTMLADGRVLITGGNNGAATLATAEIYDPTVGIFLPTAGTMAVPRQQHGSTRLADGRALIVGGTSTIGGNSVASAEIYDPATGTFSPTGSMVTARQGFGGIQSLPNGKYLIAGGLNVTGSTSTRLASAELYDPAAGTFTATGSMSAARESHGGTSLSSGQFLVTGGRGTTGAVLASAELYDPTTGTFSSAGNMSTPRMGHRVQRLSNGNVLIAGGQDNNNTVLITAELYIAGQGRVGTCFAPGGHETYSTGIAMMAIAASRDPNRVVTTGPCATQTYKQVLGANVNYFAWGQVDAPSAQRGGWGYGPNVGWADNSNTGYAVLGLRYAEADLYGFKCSIPATLKSELSTWINYIQRPDGGSDYDGSWGTSNLLRTGNLLFEMAFVGDSMSAPTPRLLNAIAYIKNHWRDPSDPGWQGNLQSMYCLMKGFQSLGIETITVGGSPVNWFDELAYAIVFHQASGGYWDWGGWGRTLNTEFALLTLEKTSPPPPVNVVTDVPGCACDVTGYQVKVTYTVERFQVNGTLKVYKDGGLVETVNLNNFSGVATYIRNVASDTPATHTWKGVLDVTPVGGGTPGHAEGSDSVKVCESPKVAGIPNQTTPFHTFDLDNYLTYGSGLPVTWSASAPPPGWTVTIDGNSVVTVTAPARADTLAVITFAASVTYPPCGIVCEGSDDAVFIANRPPDTSKAYADPSCLWPPNQKFVDISIKGVTDPDGDPVTIIITRITSDEPTASDEGSGGAKHAPDATGVGTGTASVRAERSGDGDGRVYVISFTASDGKGGVSQGTVIVKVPHDQSSKECTAIDSGQKYDATQIN